MNIAVLSAGPSLSRYWQESKGLAYDCVIAVNTAAWDHACDWVVFADTHVWQGCVSRARLPRIGVVTHPNFRTTERNTVAYGFQACWLSLRDTRCRFAADLPEGRDHNSCPWTFPNALAFAHLFPADKIDVYGFDAAVDAPCIGNLAHPGSHDAERWRSELPWVKHCWSDKVTLYSELAPAAADYLGLGVKV